MSAEIERIRLELRTADPERAAGRVGGTWQAGVLQIDYWGRPTRINWEEWMARGEDGQPLSTFDQAMLLYHLRQSDGTPLAGRWIGFRELPGGEFYHQAYQRYTGHRLVQAYGAEPEHFDRAAAPIGARLDGPAPHAWGFTVLPRISLAACLWPGDDEMPSQASVLFDGNAARHMPIDGLALLGAGLTGRLIKASGSSAR